MEDTLDPAVRSRLDEGEQKQVEAAFGKDWKKPLSAKRLWQLVGAVGLVVLFAWSFRFEMSEQGWRLLVLLVTSAYLVADERNNALVRKLHDIAAEALEEAKDESSELR